MSGESADLKDCKEPSGSELIEHYRRNFGVPADFELSEEMIMRHWRLEQQMHRELLDSTPEDRREVFQRCYDRLSEELKWLEQLMNAAVAEPPEERFRDWLGLLGEPRVESASGDRPQKVFTLIPGKAGLAELLAGCGFDCTASGITAGRPTISGNGTPDFDWVDSDGVHLDRFVEPESFDTVVSQEIIEHLYPDDLDAHFQGAAAILRSGGRYILSVPHVLAGPAGISGVFGCKTPHGMHLKEYRYLELTLAAEDAGFKKIMAPVRSLTGKRPPRLNAFFLNYQIGLEALIGLLPAGGFRRKVARASRFVYFNPHIMLVAVKE